MSTCQPINTQGTSVLDVASVRADFPILDQLIRQKPLAYLDNAATSQKPLAVVNAISNYYLQDNSNVHRGVHLLSQRATDHYEGARATIQRYIGAASTREVIFVRGATEGINLVASTFGEMHVGEGDEVVVSAMEHHSNIVPWQLLCDRKGATLKVIPMNDAGELQMDEYEALLTPRTKIVSVVHVSNALGTVNPVAEMITMAHAKGIPVLVDGAQSTPHMAVDVKALDCDFFVLSGHKVFAPTGIGVLYGKEEHLKTMPPYQGGGDMISTVSFEESTWNELPYKFEAGTPNIAGAIGLGAAFDYVSGIGIDRIAAWEAELLAYATAELSKLAGVHIVGQAAAKASVLSFVMDDVHPHDIGTIMDSEGVAIRAGHHCAQPVMQRFGIPATARASFAFYNTFSDIDQMVGVIPKIQKMFGL